MFGLGIPELIIIFLILFILFGASRLPELGKGIGLFFKNLKASISTSEELKTEKKKISN